MSKSNDWYRERLNALQSKPDPTEADVSDTLVRPVLERVLDFGVADIDAQPSQEDSGGHLRRPDFLCRQKGSVQATAIVEVKRLGTNLTKRASSSWESAPLGQLQRYLRMHRQSGDGTWGILTNGIEWIVTRREGESVRPFEQTPAVEVRSLSTIRSILKKVTSEPPPIARPLLTESDADWLDAAVVCSSPEDFLAKVTGDHELSHPEVSNNTAYQHVAEYTLSDSLLPQQVFVACICLNFPDGLLSPTDIAQEIATIGNLAGQQVIGIAYTESSSSAARLCRGFISLADSLHTTALIDPQLPGSRAEKQFASLSTGWATDSGQISIDALSSIPLHRKFHEEVGEWFSKVRGGENELRHLIRVMFSWLLQERSLLPDNALWDQGRNPNREGAVHEHISWLFTAILNKPKAQRTKSRDEWKSSLIEEVPFLNGSLFSKLSESELPKRMSNKAYLGKDGLLTILSRYDWTLHDRTGYVSESALDPTMLGDMFEQLMLQTEGPRLEGKESSYIHRKMPGGTYYTPPDVADEMVADSIAGWLVNRHAQLPWKQARDLSHPTPSSESWNTWDGSTRKKISRSLSTLTVLDPCCGSGVFTLAMLQAILRSKRRLAVSNNTQTNLDEIERVVAHQLYAVDIHPMAVLITRLRLFIALIDARFRYATTNYPDSKPLPNLETRCISANTLCVRLSDEVQLVRDQDIKELRETRRLWTVTNHPKEKKIAFENEAKARRKLKKSLEGWMSDDEIAWLDFDFLSASAPPAHHDIRHLFPAPSKGWDIVLGNPPYQKPDPTDSDRGRSLEYKSASKNLYLMFIEASLKLVKPGGCITFVVPHSIIFGRQKVYIKIRSLLENQSVSIDTRTYDNMPQPLFPKLPWLKKAEHGTQNRQRATIITINTKSSKQSNAEHTRSVIRSSGLFRLTSATRYSTLKHSGLRQEQPAWSKQWSQAPSKELADLLVAMRGNNDVVQVGQGNSRIVTFPQTAMYFISCLPDGILDNPLRKKFSISSGKYYWPWIGLFNSSLFHAYWLMIGDAFHVTNQEYGTLQPPEGWQDESLRYEIEQFSRRLMHKRTLEACHVIKMNRGEQHNINFHKIGTPGPAIVNKLDRLLLESYGLETDPLIQQLSIIRTSSAHLLLEEELLA